MVVPIDAILEGSIRISYRISSWEGEDFACMVCIHTHLLGGLGASQPRNINYPRVNSGDF